MNKTKQQAIIKSYFEHFPTAHPNAEEIYLYVKQKDQSIGMATIYRHLKKMVEQEVLAELKIEKQGVRYDLLTHEHYHFICNTCQKIVNFTLPHLEHIEQRVEQCVNGKVERKNLIFHGVCQECMKKSTGETHS